MIHYVVERKIGPSKLIQYSPYRPACVPPLHRLGFRRFHLLQLRCHQSLRPLSSPPRAVARQPDTAASEQHFTRLQKINRASHASHHDSIRSNFTDEIALDLITVLFHLPEEEDFLQNWNDSLVMKHSWRIHELIEFDRRLTSPFWLMMGTAYCSLTS